MTSTIKPFVEKSLAVNYTLLEALNDRLGLPKGTLAGLHRLDKPSYCQSRCIKNPPARGAPADKQALGAHTDYGSLVSVHLVMFDPL